MKKELTSIEIRFLVKELQQLTGAKIDQIYQPSKQEILLQLHIPNKGKKILRILLPGFVYLTQQKTQMPTQISEFARILREKISNSRVREIKQIQNERIIEIRLEKDKKYSILIELFSKGNIVLCIDKKIIAALFKQKWRTRTIKPGKEYTFPTKKYNPLKKESLKEAITQTKEKISKTLATTLGLGKTYSQEICLRTGIDKSSKKITPEQTNQIYTEIQKLTKQKTNANIIYKNQEIIDITPVKLEIYAGNNKKSLPSYNKALAHTLDKQIQQQKKEHALKKYNTQMERINTKIQKQKQTLKKLQKQAEEGQRKGEMIYEHYQEIKKELAKAKGKDKIKVSI